MTRGANGRSRVAKVRQVAQIYLDAWRAGDNADQAAVNLIVRLRPEPTLAEPADTLSHLLAGSRSAMSPGGI